MVAIINYDRGKSIALGNILENLGIDFTLTKNERDICRSEKIILPDSTNIDSTVKKLQLLNLASVLRVIKKPILGINMGFAVLCKNITGHGIEGLGLIEMDVNFFAAHEEFVKEAHSETVEVLEETKLLSGLDHFTELNFSGNHYVPVGEKTTSKTSITGIEVSASVEAERIFGIQFNPERSGVNGEQVLKNFINLI